MISWRQFSTASGVRIRTEAVSEITLAYDFCEVVGRDLLALIARRV